MSKIQTQKVVFFFLPPKLINIILLFYYFNYYFIIFLRRPILDPKIPLMGPLYPKILQISPGVLFMDDFWKRLEP